MGIEIDLEVQRLESKIAALDRVIHAENHLYDCIIEFDPAFESMSCGQYRDGRLRWLLMLSDEKGVLANMVESAKAKQKHIERQVEPSAGDSSKLPFWSRVTCKLDGRKGRLAGYANNWKQCWVEFECGERMLVDTDNIEKAPPLEPELSPGEPSPKFAVGQRVKTLKKPPGGAPVLRSDSEILGVLANGLYRCSVHRYFTSRAGGTFCSIDSELFHETELEPA